MLKINDKVRIGANAGFSDDIKEGSVGIIVDIIYVWGAGRSDEFGPIFVGTAYGVQFLGGVTFEVYYFEEKSVHLVDSGEDVTVLPFTLEAPAATYDKMEGVF